MKDLEVIADRIEEILRLVMANADGMDPSPKRYFLISDQKKHDRWILGFAFKGKEDLRTALENGVCFQIHDFVLKAFSRSKELNDVKIYIVFDFGEAAETDSDPQKLHDKFIQQLHALRREQEGGEFVTCGLCGHSVGDHLMKGFSKDESSAPTEGWMICPNKECTCFRTWSLRASPGDPD
ncbi:MAG: hypothetical protein JXB10_04645 [Pirellulales bacterium]|nr:hypothetical protein [Pirellulales bacterium]